jgi:hypothetical protein
MSRVRISRPSTRRGPRARGEYASSSPEGAKGLRAALFTLARGRSGENLPVLGSPRDEPTTVSVCAPEGSKGPRAQGEKSPVFGFRARGRRARQIPVFGFPARVPEGPEGAGRAQIGKLAESAHPLDLQIPRICRSPEAAYPPIQQTRRTCTSPTSANWPNLQITRICKLAEPADHPKLQIARACKLAEPANWPNLPIIRNCRPPESANWPNPQIR